jgi:ABC-type transport system involved in cytochrome c biogenesis permease subunit
MIFFILFAYWIFSTLCLGLSILLSSQGDNFDFEYVIIVACISVFLAWLILPAACIYHIYELLKKKFTL